MSKETLDKIDYQIIQNYYSELDTNILDNLKKLYHIDNKFKRFIDITIKYNIYLFKKNKNKWNFKNRTHIKKDYLMKKKTILRKHASNIISISKGNLDDINNSINDLNSNFNNDLKNLDEVINLYNNISDLNNFDILYSDNYQFSDITNLNKLNNINDYTLNKKIKNELKYIAEYSN